MQSSGQASFPIIENGLLFKVEHMHTGSHANLLLLDKQNEHFCCILQGQTEKTQFKIGFSRNTTFFMLLVGHLKFFLQLYDTSREYKAYVNKLRHNQGVQGRL